MMSDLSEYGILPPRSTDEPRYQERTTISHEEFCRQAGEFLFQLTEPVLVEVIPQLECYPAKWQPMGFQIYDLGIYPELGFLRLHVWPESFRRIIQRADVIHNHPRHIASTVMSGVYTDLLFDTYQVTDDDTVPQTNEYMVYGKKINSDQTEVLISKGRTVEAIVKASRTVPAGGQHFIAPSEFHQTKVPLAESCVTLVFNSFRTSADGPFILLEEPPNPVPELREPVTAEEINGVKNLFV